MAKALKVRHIDWYVWKALKANLFQVKLIMFDHSALKDSSNRELDEQLGKNVWRCHGNREVRHSGVCLKVFQGF